MKHPGRTVAQRRILDAIGCGNPSPIMSKATRDALLRDGLIIQLPDRVEKAFGPLTMRIQQFEMPVSVHMRWCDAVAEQMSA